MEYLLQPGHHLVYEWCEQWQATLEHSPSEVIIGQSGAEDRIWNAAGEELPIIG